MLRTQGLDAGHVTCDTTDGIFGKPSSEYWDRLQISADGHLDSSHMNRAHTIKAVLMKVDVE